jgi:hypothetical protein
MPFRDHGTVLPQAVKLSRSSRYIDGTVTKVYAMIRRTFAWYGGERWL